MLRVAFLLLSATPLAWAGCNIGKAAKNAVDNIDCFTDAAKEEGICNIIQNTLNCYSASCCTFMSKSYVDVYPDCTLKCGGCFPATGEVLLESSEKVSMEQLKVGDKVLVGDGVYSEVYFFSTETAESTSLFVEIVAGETLLSLTPNHYLYINGELAAANRVIVGDVITLADGSSAKVSKVGSKWGEGLYNPHTMHGDIVVNGVKTSTYTGEVHPTLAHALLYPVRKLYEAGVSFGETFSGSSKSFPRSLLDLIQV